MLSNTNLINPIGINTAQTMSQLNQKAQQNGFNLGEKIKNVWLSSNKPSARIYSLIKGLTNKVEQGETPQATQGAVPQETPDVSVKQETEATMQKELEKYYEREDAIRKETQEREDTAYQRAVADMRKAGIDPNLVGVTPAQAGGGITSATQKDLTRYSTEMNVVMSLVMQQIENEFKADQATKDRVVNSINNALSIGGKLLGSGMLAGLIG